MAGTYNLNIEPGTSVRFSLSAERDTGALDTDGNAVYEPYNFVGASATLWIGQPDQPDLELSTEDGALAIVAPNTITVHLSPENTDQLVTGRYHIDVHYESGDVDRLLSGALTTGGAE